MAPYSSTLAWKIPWKEKPGRLQSMGSLRVRHDWATSLSLFTFMHWRRKWQPTPVSCLENPRDRGAWWAAVYGPHRVGHDWGDLAAAAAAAEKVIKSCLYICCPSSHTLYPPNVAFLHLLYEYLLKAHYVKSTIVKVSHISSNIRQPAP